MPEKSNTYQAKYNRKWRKENPELHKEYSRKYTNEYRHRLRNLALQKYGGKCAKCGIDDFRVLQLDHVNNDGYKHRKIVDTAGLPLWLRRNNYPKSFQLLCANCNWIKRFEDKPATKSNP